MMRILVNGQALDIKDNANISFNKTNLLFAFDDAKAERTTSISVPATENNLRIFGLSQDFHTNGDFVRKKYDAQMYVGIVQKIGYFYVNSYDVNKREFACIFVSGETFILKELKDKGSVRYMRYTDAVNADISYSANEDFFPIPMVAKVLYRENRDETPTYDNNKVSYNLFQLITEILSKYNVSFTTEWNKNLRVISPNTDGLISKVSSRPQTSGETINSIEWGSLLQFGTETTVALNDIYGYVDKIGSGEIVSETWEFDYNIERYRVKALVLDTDISIKFPDNFPQSVMMIGNGFYGSATGSFVQQYHDYIQYAYVFNQLTGEGYIEGTSLAGRTIELHAGDTIAFFHMGNGIRSIDQSPDNFDDGYQAKIVELSPYPNGMNAFEFDLNFSTTNQANDYLEDRDVVSIMRDYLMIGGYLLNIENGVIVGKKYEELIDAPARDLENVISVGKLTRNVFDFAKRNFVQFNTDGGLVATRAPYFIDNETLKDENDVYNIEYATGDTYVESYGLELLVDYDIKEYTLGETTELSEAMMRIQFSLNPLIEWLCNKSTTLVVSVAMKHYEYEQIKNTDTFYFQGCKWAWTDAKWNDGKTTLTLVKIA